MWARAFNRVRRDVDVPTVWLAMQAVRPLAIDGNRFIAALPRAKRYLAVNLETAEYAIAIEEALRDIAGHPLVFHLIEGETLADWEIERAKLTEAPGKPAVAFGAAPTEAAPPPPRPEHAAPPPPMAPQQRPASAHGGLLQAPQFPELTTWEKLNETLAHLQRSAPLLRYPHGQARFLLRSVQMISYVMDLYMQPSISDPNQERQLSKSIERLAAMLSLDPLFVSLELMRFRQLVGKE
jgi:hypothetical protein